VVESRRPIAKEIKGPDDAAEDVPSYRQADLHDAFQFYRQNGFVLIRNLIPEECCTKVRTSFAAEVKPYAGPLPRISGHDEVNQFNEWGFLLNALMNVQRKSARDIPAYVADVLAVLTHKNLNDVLEAFFRHRVAMMTWNHFEANPVTPPHCDCHFWAQDMAIGEVTGAWIALENIHHGAGRLYVYPRSHTVDMKELLASSGQPVERISLTDSHHQRAIAEMAKSQGWTCTAPSLNAGDVLLWDSRTIHGSLATTAPDHSRSSLTAHFSSSGGRFIKPPVNSLAVSFPRYILKTLVSLWRA
jgi:phytanoyl-CoA hydroxylase